MEFETSTRAPVQRAPRSLRSLLALVLVAFVAGIGVMGWGLSQWDGVRGWMFGTEQAPAAAYPTPQTLGTLPAPSLLTPDLASRMAELEGRVAKVEAAGGTSGGNSARAEGLLVSFAARRAIDRGLGLGYVEGLLNQRFGATQPRAVATIIAAARQPATLEQLQAGLKAVTPDLAGGGPDESFWTGFKRGVSDIFVVRPAGTPSPDPHARITRAEQLIDTGRVDLALAEIARLPKRDKAAAWIAMARRHVEAHRALDLLEAAAITSGGGTPPPVAIPAPVTRDAEPVADTF